MGSIIASEIQPTNPSDEPSSKNHLSDILYAPKHIPFVNHLFFNMAATSTSANMIRRTVLNNRLGSQVSNFAEGSPRAIRPFASGSIRSIHNSARLPTITASEIRHRPTLRPHHLSAAHTRVNGQPPIGKRTIFIQTETTPNPDVSYEIFPFFFFFLPDGNINDCASYYRP